jgi:hypothetical protein
MVYLAMFSIARTIQARTIEWLLNNEMGSIQKEAVVA